MKKSLLFLLIISYGYLLKAQDVHLGAKAGVNLANIYGDDVKNELDRRTAAHLGLFLDFQLLDLVGIQAELLYSDKGAEDLSLSYVDAPLLLKVFLSDHFNLQVGPQFSYIINAEEAGKKTMDHYHTTDLSAVGGIGFQFESGLRFSARYIASIHSIGDEYQEKREVLEGGQLTTEIVSMPALDVKNAVIQISLGYAFN
jgi:hypothetical protein